MTVPPSDAQDSPAASAAADDARDLAFAISEHLARASFDDLDADTVEATKLSIIDTVGVTLASSGLTPDVEDFVALAEDMGGRPESTVLGFGGRLPAVLAAWVNGALVHGLDFDDLVRDVGYHPSTPTVPTALAVAERLGDRGRPVDGRSFLLAVALGNDLGVRLAAAPETQGAWFATPVFGCFTSAATACRLLGADAAVFHNALGIAYTQASGTLEMRWSNNSNIASFNGAWPNKAGVVAALLAERGANGIENVFEGRGGLFNVYFGGRYRREEILSGLGTHYRGKEVSFKVWPACGGSHPAIDATLHLFADNGLRADEVESVTVATTGGTFALCEPIEARRRPSTPMDAKFSIPYAVAVAAVRGNVTLDDFLPERLNDPEILDFTARITAVNDPSLAIRKAAMPARVTATTRDGRRFEYRCDQPKGTWPYSRMSVDEVVDKFRACASYARKPLAGTAVDEFVEGVLAMERFDDITPVLRKLTV